MSFKKLSFWPKELFSWSVLIALCVNAALLMHPTYVWLQQKGNDSAFRQALSAYWQAENNIMSLTDKPLTVIKVEGISRDMDACKKVKVRLTVRSSPTQPDKTLVFRCETNCNKGIDLASCVSHVGTTAPIRLELRPKPDRAGQPGNWRYDWQEYVDIHADYVGERGLDRGPQG